jgi:uncharacterized protein YggT (Ycf19 family)
VQIGSGTQRALVLPMRHIAEMGHPAFVSPSRIVVVARISRVVDYLFGVLYALLWVRLLLEFINARRSSGFSTTIRGVTAPFFAPFNFIVANTSIDGAPVVWSLVIAVIGYALLHLGIRGLLRLVARG